MPRNAAATACLRGASHTPPRPSAIARQSELRRTPDARTPRPAAHARASAAPPRDPQASPPRRIRPQRLEQLFHRARAVLSPHREASEEHAAHPGRDVAPGRDGTDATVQGRVRDRFDRVSGEGVLSVKSPVEGRAEREHVGASVDLFGLAVLLGGHVARGAEERVGHRQRVRERHARQRPLGGCRLRRG